MAESVFWALEQEKSTTDSVADFLRYTSEIFIHIGFGL